MTKTKWDPSWGEDGAWLYRDSEGYVKDAVTAGQDNVFYQGIRDTWNMTLEGADRLMMRYGHNFAPYGSREFAFNTFGKEIKEEDAYVFKNIGFLYRNPALISMAVDIIFDDFLQCMPEEKLKKINTSIQKSVGLTIYLGLGMTVRYGIIKFISHQIARRIVEDISRAGLVNTTISLATLTASLYGMLGAIAKAAKSAKNKYPRVSYKLEIKKLDLLWYFIKPHLGNFIESYYFQDGGQEATDRIIKELEKMLVGIKT